MFLIILNFFNFFLRITKGCSLLNDFQISSLPGEQPSQVVEFIYENWRIKNQENVEQGIWMKWQPFSHIQEISTLQADCHNQFIYSIERKQDNHILFLLFRELKKEISQEKFKLGLKSHFFKAPEYFYLDYENLEGVWVLFYASYNIKQQLFTFSLYQSELQDEQQIQIKINSIIIIDTLIHRVGGIQEKLIFEGLKHCFSQFQGKLSTVLLIHKREESLKNLIEDCDLLLNDCQEGKINLIDDAILNGSNFLSFETPVMEKNLFILKGWFKMNYEQITKEKYSLIKITSEIDENQNNFVNSILLQIQLFLEELSATIFFQSFKYELQTQVATVSKASQTEKSYFEAFQQWHFIQIDIIHYSNKAILFIYSQYISEQISIALDFQSYTGIISFITIGGNQLESQHYIGNIQNLYFQTFCEQSQTHQHFIIDCHYSCLQCNGPFEDNCLSCYESDFRVLKNNKCNCDSFTFDIGQNQCLDVRDLFNIKEVEISCNKNGFDVCNDEQFEIQCSFGYFSYQNDCIKCPYYQDQYNKNQDTIIQCLNCLVFPENFSIELQCNEDAVAFYFDKRNTFNRKKRDLNKIDYFEIVQLTKGQFKLQPLTYFKQNLTSLCKIGQYLNDEYDCITCGFACEKCKSEIKCHQCSFRFYLNENYNCVKCGNNCRTCQLINQKIQCLTCLDQNYLTFTQQCKPCGQFCANCNFQGYCNYCQNQYKYFISFDKINCLPCNVQNCKYCYQIQKLENNSVSTFEIHLVNLKPEILEADFSQTLCAKCESGYTLDYSSNSCIELTKINDDCIFGESSKEEYTCLSNQFMFSQNNCKKFNYCEFCTSEQCFSCQDGFYLNVQFEVCQPCTQNCKDCKQQNIKFNDYWIQETIPFYLFLQSKNFVSHQYQEVISSKLASDLEIICFECQSNYILQNSSQNINIGQCIKGCQDDCEQCEIIDQKATCIKCKSSEYGQIRSLNSQGQCFHCPKYCSACYEMEIENVILNNKYFIANNFNINYLNGCYLGQNVESGFVYLNTQFNSAIICQNYKKCYKKITFEWNLGCDNNFDYDSSIKNYWYIDEFFTRSIMNQLEIQQVYAYLNELSIKEIYYNLNLIQGSVEVCKFPQNASFKQNFQSNIFSLQNAKLRIVGKGELTKLSETLLSIVNFTEVEFINLQFISTTKLQFNNTFMNQIIFKDCIIKPFVDFAQLNFQIVSSNSYSLFLNNFTMENCFQLNTTIFNFQILSRETTTLFISITDLNIISTNFINSHFVAIDASSNKNDFLLRFANISMMKSTFSNSSFLNSYGDNNFLNFEINNLTLQHFNIISSALFQIQNALTLKFDLGQIQFGQLQENSTIILANQFICMNYQFISIQIMNSTIFTNNFNDASTINLLQIQSITLFNISINSIIYSAGMAILQQVQYGKNNYFVNVTKLKITQTQLNFENLKQFQEQSIIYLTCSICVLDQIEIVREFGLPEFQIFGSEEIIISNSIFTQNKDKVKKVMHKSQECYLQYQQDLMQYFISIYNCKKIVIQNITVNQTFTFNNPIILIYSSNIEEQEQYQSVMIQESQFFDNILIASLDSKVSIISILSTQYQTIILQNLNFTRNHLNNLEKLIEIQISTTILILGGQANIIIQNCFFLSNLLTNSASSAILIEGKTIMIQNSNFLKCNLIDFKELLKKLTVDESLEVVTQYDISQFFQIQAKGGCGKLLGQNITVNNISVNQSSAAFGGVFFIHTTNDALISIINSRFLSSRAIQDFSTTVTLGGLLYLNAQLFKLNFQMKNCEVEESFSRVDGGGIFANASATFSIFFFHQLKIINSNQFLLCHTLQGSETTYITFYEVQSRQSLEGFYKYFSLLYNLSYQEQGNIFFFNSIIKSQNVNLTIQNCTFQADINLNIAFIYNLTSANLINIYIGFSTFSTSLFSFSSKEGSIGNILMKNITLENLEQSQYQSFGVCLENEFEQQNILICDSEDNEDNEDSTIQLIDSINEIQQNQLICNLNYLQYITYQPNSLFDVDTFYEQYSFKAINIKLNSVVCEFCSFGIINFFRVKKTSFLNIYFEEISFTNSKCGHFGCISIFNEDLFDEIINMYYENRVLEQANEILQASLNFQVIISNSYFYQNTAIHHGGAIFIAGIDVLIQFSKFLYNSAYIGGAVYSLNYDESTVCFYNCLFSENSAQIAGGVFLSQQNLNIAQNLGTIILDNNSTKYGSNFIEIPSSLALFFCEGNKTIPKNTIVQTSQSILEETVILPYTIFEGQEKVETLTFPSGQRIASYAFAVANKFETIQSNFSFRIITLNSQNQRQNNLQDSYCFLSIKVMNKTSQTEHPALSANLSYYKTLFNTTSGDYNLDDLIIEFNPYYDQDIVLRIFISSDAVQIPIYDKEPPYLIIDYITNYSLFVDVKTLPCQLGEYLNSTNGACYQCDVAQFQYQVKFNSTICQFKDDQKIDQLTSSMIQLRQYYWRAYYYSSKIEYCFNFIQNCKGGWISGDKSCFIGHIGALCEQCDLYNVRGKGSFSVSSAYKCGNCAQIYGNIVSIILINLWTLISIILSVNSQMSTIIKFSANKMLSNLNVHCILKEPSTAVLIKIFTNYIQIISTLQTFQLHIPEELSGVFKVIGSPLEQMAYSLDCFLIKISGIEIIYFRIIWSFIQTCIIILFYLIIILIGIIIKYIKYDVTLISSMLIYLFIYLQPNFIKNISSLVSFRQISEVNWIQGNVAYRYESTSHQFWLISFCLPIFTIFAVLIPGSLFYGVFNNRKKLENIHTRKVFGFLYNEYKLEAYYWEFIKLIQKVCIVIVLTFYEDFIAIKASLVFLLIFAYSYLTTSKSPYLTGELNKLDFQSIIVCAISIILSSSIYLAQQNQLLEITWSFYIIIVVLNCLLFVKIILKIVMTYFQKNSAFIDKTKSAIALKLKAYFPCFPNLSKFFQSSSMKQQKIKERFAKLRNYLIPEARKIIKFKQVFRLNDQTSL